MELKVEKSNIPLKNEKLDALITQVQHSAEKQCGKASTRIPW